jgi:hypothetical protein
MNEEKTQNKKQSDYAQVITFRAPKIVVEQLKTLQYKWGENATQVIHRAIALALEQSKRG